jgi:hypothetical protein
MTAVDILSVTIGTDGWRVSSMLPMITPASCGLYLAILLEHMRLLL